mmetsp:Transcript_34482/g.101334  ORF Transcript_34482/g.101334 Transcript_34482/m.101334 type:complete len:967 (+) Transcript_34482:220-3120(+)|eukprot:CAMPEP_0181070830 /NCGR_PEP_ID=MMETSP1070-20121207/27693_1 /TAXON_ID=265543 /ORGANISM="Minutocellus polymorphus, Strain NH13" /LENGTH=966 /DNA_ID=CAMNT_0023151737 /DNA_START=146 /DNA_END=3046 /DNA_ORIENTATION=-
MTPTNTSGKMMCNSSNALLSLLFLLLWPIGPALAILPTGSIDVTSPTTGERFTLLASQASFGSYPAMGPSSPVNPLMELILPPADDPLLCAETDGTANYTNLHPHRERGRQLSWFGSSSKSNAEENPNRAMLVPRGSCTFERKALSAQRLGATAVILYGTLDSRYALNRTVLAPNATDAERKAAADRTYTIDDVLWPGDKYDYDCSYGRAHVPTSLLSFDPLPYNGRYNDAKLTGTLEEGNLCAVHSDPTQAKGKNFADLCPSKRCLLTGKTNKDGQQTDNGGVQVSDIVGGASGIGGGVGGGGGTTMEACCAWDLHVWLYSDPSIPTWYEPVHIPAFYVTMEEGWQLLATMAETDSAAAAAVGVTMYARWAPKYNPSAALIWALGVLICFVASYMSASEYRGLRFEAKRRLFEMTIGSSSASSIPSGGPDEGLVGGDRFDDEPQPAPMEADVPSASGSSSTSTPRSRSRSRSPEERPQQQQQGHYAPSHAVGATDADAVSVAASAAGSVGASSAGASSHANAPATYQHHESQAARSSFNSQDESMELTAGHALGFVVMASCSLTVLFVFKIYSFVKIMYAFGCSGAMTQMLFFPLWDRIAGKLGLRRKLYQTAFNAGQEFGPVTFLDLLAGISGYGLGLAWLITAFYFVHPEEKAFFWIVQDIMGSCMCILFLSIIKLNSIRVAAILLIIAFFYDIFFVFVTPLLTKGGKSIMITVATSGGPPKADPSWCEKYPRDNDCKGGDPLPMLLTVPRLFDYQGGSSLLGLGDIVLPGLLLSFAARFDEAKKLVGLIQTGNTAEIYPRSYNCLTVCCRSLCSGGYLLPVTVAYAVGLCMANVAVYMMQMGQPALLYLVPCCLGTMTFLGWKKGELKELWDGPNAIRNADALLFGEYDYNGPVGHNDCGGDDVDEGNGAEDQFPPTIAQIPPKQEDVASTASTGPLEVVTAAGEGGNAARKRGSKGSGSLL